MTKNVFIAILAGLAILFLILWMTKKPRTAPSVVAEWRSADSALKMENEVLKLENDSLKDVLAYIHAARDSVRKVYIKIPAKYDSLRSDIYFLPADRQLQLFSKWLSQIDTVGRR